MLRGGIEARAAFPIAIAAALLSVAWLPLVPLIAFKPQERSLYVDERGLKTEIGKRFGERTWSEVKSVRDHDGSVVVTVTNGNAFIVPRRAFATEAERAEFLARVMSWFQARGGPR
jgi:hypothetical protein